MQAEQLVQQGDLAGALAQLQEAVRNKPEDAKLRVFLFQLLVIMGQWKRAGNQLDVVAQLDPAALPMAQACRPAIMAELTREAVFRGERSPMIFGEPEPWIANLVHALGLVAQGNHEKAAEIHAEALEQAPAVSGSINGEPFEWIADADSTLGPVLEAVVEGRYYWIPFHRLTAVALEEPTDLRDIVWQPATLAFASGGSTVAFVLARYAGSASSEDPQIRLGRRTEWTDRGSGLYTGLGQRLLATDADEYPILNVRAIDLNVEPAEQPDTDPADATA